MKPGFYSNTLDCLSHNSHRLKGQSVTKYAQKWLTISLWLKEWGRGQIFVLRVPVWLTLQQRREISFWCKKNNNHFLLPGQTMIANKGVWWCFVNPTLFLDFQRNSFCGWYVEQAFDGTRKTSIKPSYTVYIVAVLVCLECLLNWF